MSLPKSEVHVSTMGQQGTNTKDWKRTGICINSPVLFYQIVVVANAMAILAGDVALSRCEFILCLHIPSSLPKMFELTFYPIACVFKTNTHEIPADILLHRCPPRLLTTSGPRIAQVRVPVRLGPLPFACSIRLVWSSNSCPKQPLPTTSNVMSSTRYTVHCEFCWYRCSCPCGVSTSETSSTLARRVFTA